MDLVMWLEITPPTGVFLVVHWLIEPLCKPIRLKWSKSCDSLLWCLSFIEDVQSLLFLYLQASLTWCCEMVCFLVSLLVFFVGTKGVSFSVQNLSFCAWESFQCCVSISVHCSLFFIMLVNNEKWTSFLGCSH